MGSPTTPQVVRRFAIVCRPGRVPETKRPLLETDAGLVSLLRNLRSLYPAAQVIAAELTWDHQLWVADAGEVVDLAMVRKSTRELQQTDAQLHARDRELDGWIVKLLRKRSYQRRPLARATRADVDDVGVALRRLQRRGLVKTRRPASQVWMLTDKGRAE